MKNPSGPLKSEDQNKFQALVESIEDYAILMLDKFGNIKTWNLGALKIQGFSAQEIIGKHFSNFYAAEDIAAGKPARDLELALQLGKFEEEGFRLKKDGSKFWVNVIITPLRDDHGAHSGYSLVLRDLSEKRKTDERYRLLVDNIKDYAIFMLDPSGYIQSWNAGAERINGYAASEIIGQHFSKFYPEEANRSGHPARELTLAAANGTYEEEGWRLRKDGSRFWANVLITRLNSEEGHLQGYAKVVRDLTDRRVIEQALKESEERFRLMVESVKDYAILMLDPDGHIASWNAGAERIKGWKANEIIGRHFSVFYLPEDIKAGKIEYELAIAQREGRFEDYSWRVRKDGTHFFANVVITPLWDEKKSLRGYSKVTRDITERRRAEEELKRAYEDLETRVEERTRAVVAANKELESFSYSVSHDLRAPLRSMDGFSKALITYYGDKLDSRGQDFLKRIRDSSQKMGRLIDDILNLSRLGRQELKFKTVNMSRLAEEVIVGLKSQDPQRDVEFSVQPEMVAYADQGLMQVVVENLLQNSFKYSSKIEHARIEMGMTATEDRLVFFVKDNGAGFDMAFADKLFGSFQRLHSDHEFPGTGIGLALVRRVISRHGGDVWAEGQVNKGATFYFSIPRSESPL